MTTDWRYAIGEPGTAGDVEGLPATVVSQQPDTIVDGGEVGALTVRAASVRGAGHRYDGTPRQDDLCLAVAGPAGEWLVAAVADGVSAGRSSHLAARAAVRFGVRKVQEVLASAPLASVDWDEVVGATAGFVLAQARKEVGDPDLPADRAAAVMATTVVFVVVGIPPGADGSRPAVVVPVGDTSAWALSGGTWHPLSPVKNDGAAVLSSATAALPYLPPDLAPVPVTLHAGDALFAVSDGIGDPLADGRGEVGARLAELWAQPPDRYQFAAQVDFSRRSHTDDRTAVGIWTEPPPPPPPPPVAEASEPDPGAGAAAPVVPDATGLDGWRPEAGAGVPPPPPPPPPSPPEAGHPDPGWSPTPGSPTPWTPAEPTQPG